MSRLDKIKIVKSWSYYLTSVRDLMFSVVCKKNREKRFRLFVSNFNLNGLSPKM